MNLDHLERTPAALRELLAGVTEEEAAWKPAPERFSIAEALAHLAHTERFCYGERIRKWAAEETPELEPYDTDAEVASRAYSGRPLRESIDEYARERAANIAALRAMPDQARARIAVHRRVGPLKLDEMLSECAYHELGHLKQIAELLRALRFHPNMGPFRREYQVNP